MKSRLQINKRTEQKTISHQWFRTDTSCITLIDAYQCKQHSIKRIARDREVKMISWLHFRKFSLLPHGTLWGLITVPYNGIERRQLFWSIVSIGLVRLHCKLCIICLVYKKCHLCLLASTLCWKTQLCPIFITGVRKFSCCWLAWRFLSTELIYLIDDGEGRLPCSSLTSSTTTTWHRRRWEIL